ncbi:unnamed protein product [Candidula unifasciata]|uniref:Uncharacterized protein n=1 Tax=Candidula unifasciata TaxID=100452 RepID=A0A8S3ZQD6_9EUPU|nr:unnamed protein product [Candidula unifasciata]
MNLDSSNRTYIIVGDSVMNPPNLTMTGVDAAYILFSNITAIFSIAACLVIFSVFVAYKEIRTPSRLLLVFLSCADVVVNISSLLQTATYYKSFQFPKQTSFLCQTAAGVLVYSQVCSALWTLAITFYLLLCMGGHCPKVSNRVMLCFHVFCWLMPRKFSAIGDNSQWIVNAVFFCLVTQKIRGALVKNFHRWCKFFCGWFSKHRIIGKSKWMKVQSIVRVRARLPWKSRSMDGSVDIDLSGISLDLPVPEEDLVEDDVIFER